MTNSSSVVRQPKSFSPSRLATHPVTECSKPSLRDEWRWLANEVDQHNQAREWLRDAGQHLERPLVEHSGRN